MSGIHGDAGVDALTKFVRQQVADTKLDKGRKNLLLFILGNSAAVAAEKELRMWKLVLPVLGILAYVPTVTAVEFRFAPADGLECEQHYKSTVIKDVGDVALGREDSIESLTHLKFEKTAQGHRVTATTKSAQMKRDGQPVDDPMTRLLIGREIVLDVGADGVLNDVHGYEDLRKDMMAMLPPEAQKAMAGVLNAEIMRNREIAEWNGRIAQFVGKNVQEGDVWEGEDEFSTPAGPIRFTTLTRFSKVDTRDGRPMVTIDFAYAADGEAAKKMMEQILQGLPSMGAEIPPASAEPTIHGGGERVVDASTMNIEREKVGRVISAPLQMPDGSQAVMTRTETKEYTFDCSK